MKTERFEPGVSFRPHAPLLGDLPLKPVRLGTVWRERRIGVADYCRRHGEGARASVREHREELNGVTIKRPSKEGRKASAFGNTSQHSFTKFTHGEERNLL